MTSNSNYLTYQGVIYCLVITTHASLWCRQVNNAGIGGAEVDGDAFRAASAAVKEVSLDFT